MRMYFNGMIQNLNINMELRKNISSIKRQTLNFPSGGGGGWAENLQFFVIKCTLSITAKPAEACRFKVASMALGM